MTGIWIFSNISFGEFIFHLIIPSTVFGLLSVISILWIRNYDIHLFEIGLGIENKWRLFGIKKWKFKYVEIQYIEIRIPYAPQSSANFIMKIDSKKFALLNQCRLVSGNS